MGAAPRFRPPKGVWSPAGGWWCVNPPNAARNAGIAASVFFTLSLIGAGYVSSIQTKYYVDEPVVSRPWLVKGRDCPY